MKIAILGWGSLIWDEKPEFIGFNNQLKGSEGDKWLPGGPTLKLEFSRISSTRGDALTLVIDDENGDACTVQYAMSERRNPDDAICDLRGREGTVLRRIGYYFADDSRKGEPNAPETVRTWVTEKKFDVVIWTGLPTNFTDKTKMKFSVETAIQHLRDLETDGQVKAREYISKAPASIDTPLRRALKSEPSFNE